MKIVLLLCVIALCVISNGIACAQQIQERQKQGTDAFSKDLIRVFDGLGQEIVNVFFSYDPDPPHDIYGSKPVVHMLWGTYQPLFPDKQE